MLTDTGERGGSNVLELNDATIGDLDSQSLKSFIRYKIQCQPLSVRQFLSDEDIHSDVIEIIAKYRKKILNIEKFARGVVNRVVSRHIRQGLREERIWLSNTKEYSLTGREDSMSVQERMYSDIDYSFLIEKLREVLTEEELSILTKKYIENFSWEEIARDFGISAEVVKKRGQRIRKKVMRNFDKNKWA